MIKRIDNPVIESSKEILGGEIVFKGTRVPVRALIDYLKAGDSIKDFLDDFPTVTQRQIVGVLELAQENIAKR